MKFICLPLLLILCWSCGGGTPAADSDAATTETVEPAAAAAKTPAQIDHPCDAISWSAVATVFDWEGTNESMPTTMSDGRMQACYYAPPRGAGSITISVTQSTERTISAKYLEKAFTKDLASTDGNREQVAPGPGDQAIYSHGRNGPNYAFRLRWRDGNEVDYFIEFRESEEMDAAAVLPKLKALAEKL